MENEKWKMEMEMKMETKAKNARNWAITHKCTLTRKLNGTLVYGYSQKSLLYHKYEMLFCKY